MAQNVPEMPPPVLLAALVCDMVIIDALTSKGTVVGIFDTINATTYPVQHSTLFVFCQLTNGRGRVTIRIRIVDLKDEEEKSICESTVDQEFTDIREVANVVFGVGGLRFPHPGEYRVQVFVGTDFLGERRIICNQVAPRPGGKMDEQS